MNSDEAAAAMLLARTINAALMPLLVLFVGTSFAWASWMTWTLRSIKQTVEKTGESNTRKFNEINGQLDGIEESNEKHRIDDAASFGKLGERTDLLARILAHAEFYRASAEEKLRTT